MTGLFERLFDDAAIFPPGNAPLPAAVSAHRAHLTSEHASTVGPFLCSVARWRELRAALGHDDAPPLPLRLVTNDDRGALLQAVEAVARDVRVGLDGVEVAVADVEALPGALRLVAEAVPDAESARFVELPITHGLPQALEQLASSEVCAKFRTGGATAAAFPSEQALAGAVHAAIAAAVPFKLTAGLHHAMRQQDPATGIDHHGFLNVLAAVAAASEGATPDHLRQLLHEPNADAIVAAVSAADARAVRRRFRSLGTCSIDDPVSDLRSLGLLHSVAS